MKTGSKAPIFQGLPSPSLKKMRRMTKEQLVVHINTLDEQAKVIRQKLERKQQQPDAGSALKSRNAERQLLRLEALSQYARDLMTQQAESPSSGYSRMNPRR